MDEALVGLAIGIGFLGIVYGLLWFISRRVKTWQEVASEIIEGIDNGTVVVPGERGEL